MSRPALSIVSALVLSLSQPVLAAGGGGQTQAPAGVHVVDDLQRLAANRISVPVTNTGSFTWDRLTGTAGLEYPAGSGHTAMFAAGLWVSARQAGQLAAAVAGNFDEFRPGSAPLGLPGDPSAAAARVYRLRRHYASEVERDAAYADYVNGAVVQGAPGIARLPDGSLDVPGDEMLWSVCNDFDAAFHLGAAGGTPPLGLEVQQTTFAFDQPGALGSTVFVRYRLLNRGAVSMDSLIAGIWVDADLGQAPDDLAGCDPARSLAYAYNAAATDPAYGNAIPAVGVDVLQGVRDPVTHLPRGLTAFRHHGDLDAPTSAVEGRALLMGLTRAGGVLTNPFSLQPTPYEHAGDPVAHSGWLDTSAEDERLLLASGPTTLAPGESQDVVVALIVAQAADRLGSVALLRGYDDVVQSTFDAGGLARLSAPPVRGGGLTRIGRVTPDPVRGSMELSVFTQHAAPRLELFDLAGRRVAEHVLAGGGHEHVRWDGAASAIPGVYLLRLSDGPESATRRIVVLH